MKTAKEFMIAKNEEFKKSHNGDSINPIYLNNKYLESFMDEFAASQFKAPIQQESKTKWFIENENQEWFYSELVFPWMENNTSHFDKPFYIDSWTKDPCQAIAFDTQERAETTLKYFIIAKEGLKVTEHEFPVLKEEVPNTEQGKERFKMPTDEQLVKFAMLFNEHENVVDTSVMADMVAMCQLILDRLYENGDIMIKAIEEDQGKESNFDKANVWGGKNTSLIPSEKVTEVYKNALLPTNEQGKETAIGFEEWIVKNGIKESAQEGMWLIMKEESDIDIKERISSKNLFTLYLNRNK